MNWLLAQASTQPIQSWFNSLDETKLAALGVAVVALFLLIGKVVDLIFALGQKLMAGWFGWRKSWKEQVKELQANQQVIAQAASPNIVTTPEIADKVDAIANAEPTK